MMGMIYSTFPASKGTMAELFIEDIDITNICPTDIPMKTYSNSL
jgi:hypothetical protein